MKTIEEISEETTWWDKVQAYAKFLEAWQMFHSRGIQQEVTPITLAQFNNDKFIVIALTRPEAISND